LSLDSADIRALIQTLPANERQMATSSLASLEQVVRAELVRRTVLGQAQSRDFLQQPETLAALDRVRNEALVRLWVANQAKVPPGYPSEAEIKAAYDANQAALVSPTQYRLAQIFINAPDGSDPAKLSAALSKATDVTGKLSKMDFNQLAQSASEDPDSASHGGDLGYLADNRMAPEVLAVVRTLNVGQVAGPVKTARGLHFLKLLDKKPGTVPPLAQVHDALAGALKSRRAGDLERAYLASLNDKLGVTVNQIELAKLQPALAVNRP
jgi:peptidylprolyl isomerase